MAGFGFDFDAPTRNVENAPERSVAGSGAAAVDSKHGGGVLPYDVVEPPVGLGNLLHQELVEFCLALDLGSRVGERLDNWAQRDNLC